MEKSGIQDDLFLEDAVIGGGDREYRDLDSVGEHSGLGVVFEWTYCAHGGQG